MVRIPQFRSLFFATLGCAGIAGCGGTSDTAGSANSAPLQTTPAVSLSVISDSNSAAGTATTRSTDNSKARQLFESLVTPGSGLDWDQTHQELLGLGESAVQLLAEKLSQGTAAEKELAATTLALFGPDATSATTELLGALQDQSPFVRANAAATLVQLPDHAADAVPTLIQLLQADDPQLRQLAAVNLNAAGMATTGHLESLKLALSEETSTEVLTPIVELLGRIGPSAESALPELQKIASRQQDDLGAAAHSAIQLISGETAAP